MKIRSLNQIPEKYGMAEVIEYNNDSFKGHQIGLCVGIKDNQTGELKSHIASKDPNISDVELLEEFLKEDFLILEDTINNIIEDKLVLNAKTFYYVPYYVIDHSVFQPTPNFTNISFAQNVKNHVKYEVLFVDEEEYGNRYLTLDFHTSGGNFNGSGSVSMSFLDIIECLEMKLNQMTHNSSDDRITIKDEVIKMTFYDKIGNPYDKKFNSIKDMLSYVTSVRMIDCVTEIIKD